MAIIIELEFDENDNLLSATQASLSESLEVEGEIFEDVADFRAQAEFEQIERRELLERLMMLAKLKPRERMVLHLYAYGEGFSKIGQRLNISRQHAKQIFSIAIRKLQKAAVAIGELEPTEAAPSLRQAHQPTQRRRDVHCRAECTAKRAR